MADTAPGTAPVTDRRITPRGVLPRNAQTWLMVAVALGILGIIVLTGNREPESRPVSAASTPMALNPERLRDYQDRLRVLDDRARQAVNEARVEPPPPVQRPYEEPPMSAAPDPLETERQRREYDSLFASNVVLSRRPNGQRLTANETAARWTRAEASEDALAPPPTIDQVADAVVRATSRYAQSTPGQTTTGAPIGGSTAPAAGPLASPQEQLRPVATAPISSIGPLHPVLEGTLIDTVLTNRLDGSVAAPVNCLVTNAVYSHDGRRVLIPAGSRVLGETKPVQAFGDTRLAVSFNRLVLPDGRTYRLDQFMGLNDIGDAGLRDQVNQHYKSTFGASAAVGLISGLAQYLGTAGFNRGDGDRTVIIAGGVGDATSQATAQAMNRFLNRTPSITIREGHRVKVYVTSDFQLPAYEPTRSRHVLTTNR
jgi:type IV secretory pathway VirB10-like protein